MMDPPKPGRRLMHRSLFGRNSRLKAHLSLRSYHKQPVEKDGSCVNESRPALSDRSSRIC